MRYLAVLAVLAAATPASAQGYIKWEKYEKSFALAAAADKPVLVFCGGIVQDASEKDMKPIDKAWGADEVRKLASKFVFTQATNRKTLALLAPKAKGEMIFLDPDGDEFHRGVVSGEPDILATMQAALSKYAPREVDWLDWSDEVVADAKAQKKMIILAFTADSGETTFMLKNFEAASIVKHQETCLFARIPFEKDSDAAKLWKARSVPTIIAVNPYKEPGRRATLVSLSGARKLPHVKAFMARAWKALERDADWKKAKPAEE